MGLMQSLTSLAAGAGHALRLHSRDNRLAPVLSNELDRTLGVGQDWMPLTYGEYYPRSALVYAAVKLRQDSVSRVPLKVFRRGDGVPRPGSPGVRGQGLGPSGSRAVDSAEAVGPDHPAQRLLDAPNPFWTRSDLWRATETYLGLWGSAFWGLERDQAGQVVEIWPLRSDRMRVVPDPDRYVKGFVFVGQGQQLVPYVPEDVVWIKYFNPLDEYAGLSPIAPLRLSADMGMDALRANRHLLMNDSTPGLIIETTDAPTDAEVQSFYERWESRFRGVRKTRRPALLSPGMKASNLGFSPRDMEFIQSLRWSLEDIARVYGVPKVMMGDLERTTFSNFQTARRVFWEDTIVSQLAFYQEKVQHMLMPNFGDPSLFVEFDLSQVQALRENENDLASRRQQYVSSGIMTVDEVRQEMNLPALGGDGG
ncbi:MAG: phage portal protein [Chloroflexi bacterium]|nr:phage portal protein [Chloroflexota bacterium]MCH7653076.1 phage portal protein [Chloroflexota bacterium]